MLAFSYCPLLHCALPSGECRCSSWLAIDALVVGKGLLRKKYLIIAYRYSGAVALPQQIQPAPGVNISWNGQSTDSRRAMNVLHFGGAAEVAGNECQAPFRLDSMDSRWLLHLT